ncbi:MAG: DNA cytosine methyltransferase [Pseudomonadota bacterium]
MSRIFYEFFCGGGMARLGLGPGWTCALANDVDRAKCAAYRDNFGGDHLIEGDIHDLTAADLPGEADLAWASFPCQDLSLAGARAGFGGGRSAAFWGFHDLIQALRGEGRPPKTLIIENVAGFATSRGGADLAAALGALAEAGYRYDVRLIDAAAFLPQSRPRLFIIAWDAASLSPPTLSPTAPPLSRGAALERMLAALPPAAVGALAALSLPAPPAANIGLAEIVEPTAPTQPGDAAERLLAMMAPTQRAKVTAALAEAAKDAAPRYGAAFRRMRGGVQRAEVRFDRAGCLRTPAGGSSRQILVIARPDGRVETRRFTGREAARLMGLPDKYKLPQSETQALRLAGDGVAVPVVRWIVDNAVAKILSGSLEPAAAAE